MKSNLNIKSIKGQRERTSLLQDLNLILRGDKALFKPVVDAAKKHNDNLKRRSIALFAAKQLFYTSHSSMRLLKR